jgi:hypothetical protein
MAVTKEQMEKLTRLKKSLEEYRAVFQSQWNDIIQYLAASYASATIGKPGSQPAPNYRNIQETTGVDSSNIMADGLQGYAFGRSISWFRLQFENERLMENESFKEWLQSAERIIYKQLNNSNFYDESRSFVKCGADFGTAVMIMEYDESRSVPVFSTLHPGTYAIQENRHGVVDTLFRDLWLTREEAIEQFDKDKLPPQIKDSQDPGESYLFHHYVGPSWRLELDVDGDEEFISVYWADIDANKTVKEERFGRKTFFAWRWAKNPCKSPWGVDSPGLTQIPNIKMLQSFQGDQLRVSQLHGRPPIKKTSGLRINFLPSGMTDLEPGQDFAPVQVTGDLSWTQMTKQEIVQQVKSAYYVDFFLALMQSQNTNKNKTATEVAALQDEKAAIMSAFTSRLSHEFIEPVLEAVFEAEAKRIRFPQIPNGMQAQQLKIDYVSPLSMMQKRSHGLATTRQFLGEIMQIGQMAQVVPKVAEVFDKLKMDGYVDVAGEAYDVDHRIIESDENVQKIRQARAQMQMQMMQQQQQMQQAQVSADVLAKGSKAPEEGSPTEQMIKQGRRR